MERCVEATLGEAGFHFNVWNISKTVEIRFALRIFSARCRNAAGTGRKMAPVQSRSWRIRTYPVSGPAHCRDCQT